MIVDYSTIDSVLLRNSFLASFLIINLNNQRMEDSAKEPTESRGTYKDWCLLILVIVIATPIAALLLIPVTALIAINLATCLIVGTISIIFYGIAKLISGCKKKPKQNLDPERGELLGQ